MFNNTVTFIGDGISCKISVYGIRICNLNSRGDSTESRELMGLDYKT
jgi:hypothetical protein